MSQQKKKRTPPEIFRLFVELCSEEGLLDDLEGLPEELPPECPACPSRASMGRRELLPRDPGRIRVCP